MKRNSQYEQLEKIPTRIAQNANEACREVAQEIAALIRSKSDSGQNAVLGLATGSTPVPLYRELIRLYREDGLSFQNVITFNLDEYHGLSQEHPESYWRFMHEQLFDHIDIPSGQVNVPDGKIATSEAFEYCATYEEKIEAAGGIDLQVLGIGRTGHIGFNEPGSPPDSLTRMIALDSLTIRDAAADFQGERNVPRHAITMGVGTILAAERVVLMAWGQNKSDVIAEAVEGPETESISASFLQRHSNATFFVDQSAASRLTRIDRPWLVGPVDWKSRLIRKAVSWLSLKQGKPILKLLDEDYTENGMGDLITPRSTSYHLNIKVFNDIQRTITGWPGGKPNADDSQRPERADPHPKRALIISPEPDNDLLGMGGTLKRLMDQRHDPQIAYLTSGSLMVPDSEAKAMAEFAQELQPEADENLPRSTLKQLEEKSEFDLDSTEIRDFKGHIRRVETRSALRRLDVQPKRIHFLDLAFYQKGRPRQFRFEEADVSAVVELLREVQPHQVYLTGIEADPSALPAICFALVNQAIERCSGDDWLEDCRIWLYRLPERNWEIEEIDMAVPISPKELTDKIQAIYHHKSQRSQSPGGDVSLREHWQQTEKTNQDLAVQYDHLGLAEYEAIEAFQRWR